VVAVKVEVDSECTCGAPHTVECLPIPTHPGLVISPGFACPGRGQACPSITHSRSGAAVVYLQHVEEAPAAVAWIDQQLPDIDWTMSGAEIRRAAGKAGTGLQQRYGREVGHDDRPPAGVASLERLSR